MISLPVWIVGLVMWSIGYCCAALITNRKGKTPLTAKDVFLVAVIYALAVMVFIPLHK
jgi:hypothetical protein